MHQITFCPKERVLWLQCRKCSTAFLKTISDQNFLHIGDIHRECIFSIELSCSCKLLLPDKQNQTGCKQINKILDN